MTESATRTEIIAAEPAESLAAVFDLDPPTDAEVPELWHWLYLLDRRLESELGPMATRRPASPRRPALVDGGCSQVDGSLRCADYRSVSRRRVSPE